MAHHNRTMARPPSQTAPEIPDKKMGQGFSGQRLVIIPPERVASAGDLPVLRDLQVTHFGHFGPAKNHFVHRRQGSGEYILIYCLAGEGHCLIGGNYWRVGAGDALVLPPHEAHTYHAEPSNPWTIFWFHFKGTRAADYVEVLRLEGDCPVVHSPRPDALHQAFEDAYSHSWHEFTDVSLLALSTSLARIIGLLAVYSDCSGVTVYRSEDRILQAMRTMLKHPTREWPLDELAAAVGMSVRNFSAAFHKQVGSPPKQFLIRQRLQMASVLLSESDLTVSEIAEQVGYPDFYYFSRLFRKKTGMSPSRYRAHIAKTDGRS